MTFVSLTQARVRLGIDAKTLHRWLAQAQLPVQPHPQDSRQKSLSCEHLHLLASLHQRHLLPSPQEPQEPRADAPCSLPASLLALPESMAALQEQLCTLQQQLAILTRLLESQQPAPAKAAAATKPSSGSAPAATSARTPRARAAVKPPHKPVHVIPRVEYGHDGRYVVTSPKHGVLSFAIDTPEWFAWVAKQSSFRFVGQHGHFTAHHEWRVPSGAWRAHRHLRNRSYTLRLAPNPQLTSTVLEQAALALQAHLS